MAAQQATEAGQARVSGRQVVEMTPANLRRRGRGEADSASEKLRQAIRSLGEVREPGQAEEPILAPSVRKALFGWLAEIRAAEELKAVGLVPRTTALAHGPPGCGKTTLAHHLAARLGVPMVIVGPETIHDMYLGQSERNVARLFAALAEADTPALLFMDEIDALGGKRKGSITSGAGEARLNTLTVLLRKVEEHRGYLVAATNRPDDVDPALWRRFHMQISVDLPGADERFAILRRYGLPFGFRDEDLDLLTELTPGASPALLRGLMENMKRALVVGDKIGWPIHDPVALVETILVALKPPPEIQPPPLWSNREARAELKAMAWPPERPAP